MRIILFLVFIVVPGQLLAGDYFHACASPGGEFQFDHDSQILTRVGDPKNRTINYSVVRKIIIEKRTGYCQSQKCNARFNFEGQEYFLNLSVKEPDLDITINFLCEVAASGLPAACECDREVVTQHQKLKPQYSNLRGNTDILPDREQINKDITSIGSPSSVWNHNGSTMNLFADGANRTLRYRSPRPELRSACAQSGDIVFDGEKQGSKFIGEAALFSCTCGRVTFPVSGRTTRNGSRIIVRGKAPNRDASCNVVGQQTSTLVFDYLRKP